MENKDQLKYLFDIYQQQHYFIDRHDSMAEKFINILLVQVTCISVLYTIYFNGFQVALSNIWQLILIGIYIVMLTVTLAQLLLIVRPLSSKAKKQNDASIIYKGNKAWVENSSFYYQGIINQIDSALSSNKVPSECFLEQINTTQLTNDLVQQIFILAQYSNYKKTKLEKSLIHVGSTFFLGLLSVFSLIFV